MGKSGGASRRGSVINGPTPSSLNTGRGKTRADTAMSPGPPRSSCLFNERVSQSSSNRVAIWPWPTNVRPWQKILLQSNLLLKQPTVYCEKRLEPKPHL